MSCSKCRHGHQPTAQFLLTDLHLPDWVLFCFLCKTSGLETAISQVFTDGGCTALCIMHFSTDIIYNLDIILFYIASIQI